MKSELLAAALLAIVAIAITVGTGSVISNGNYCPSPSAASVAALFAPCQAFDEAMGHAISKPEALRKRLLTPDEQPLPVTTRFASREFDAAPR
jgi:hypothetical protein